MGFDRHTQTPVPLSIHYTEEYAFQEQPAPVVLLNKDGVLLCASPRMCVHVEIREL